MLNFERQQQNYLSMIENSLHLYLPEEGQGQGRQFVKQHPCTAPVLDLPSRSLTIF